MKILEIFDVFRGILEILVVTFICGAIAYMLCRQRWFWFLLVVLFGSIYSRLFGAVFTGMILLWEVIDAKKRLSGEMADRGGGNGDIGDKKKGGANSTNGNGIWLRSWLSHFAWLHLRFIHRIQLGSPLYFSSQTSCASS